MSDTLCLADLGRCVPAGALSAEPNADQWLVTEYDAGEFTGRMIAAAAFADPLEVELPIELAGWHTIRVGIWGCTYHDTDVKYRLSNEDVFSVVHLPHAFTWDRTELVETFARPVDLTGATSIVFSKRPTVKACIAYVKLQRLSDEEVEALAQDRSRTDTKRLIALHDGGDLLCPWHDSRLALREIAEQYRHTDVGQMMWGVNGGDMTTYPHTRVGHFCADDTQAAGDLGEVHWLENHRRLAAEGVRNPFEVVMERCHEIGMKFHLYYRMSMACHPRPIGWSTGQSWWLKEHPQCRQVHKDGTPMPMASYAFPEVREFMLSLIEEGMGYDIDGVNICLPRGPEYFAYEKPILDDFQKQYGQDPRDLPDRDPRLLTLRAGYLTEIMRGLRALADRRGAERGRKIEVSVWIDHTDERMLYFGQDGYTWIREGLIDWFVGHGPQKLLRLAKEKGIRVYSDGPALWDRDKAIEAMANTMKNAFAAGLDGATMWDVNFVKLGPECAQVLSRIGHKEELLDLPWIASLLPKMKRTALVSVAQYDVSRTTCKNSPGGFPPEMLSMFAGG